jgi:hypothetical protein
MQTKNQQVSSNLDLGNPPATEATAIAACQVRCNRDGDSSTRSTGRGGKTRPSSRSCVHRRQAAVRAEFRAGAQDFSTTLALTVMQHGDCERADHNQQDAQDDEAFHIAVHFTMIAASSARSIRIPGECDNFRRDHAGQSAEV